jgi:transcriptional regulator with XRE-family HTH domain
MKTSLFDSAIIKLVADNVRTLRKAADMSQEELAHEAGVDRTYISQVERRRRNVTIIVIARIARALKVTPDRLLIIQSSGQRKRP